MPIRFFRKFAVKRHHFGDKWFLSPFRHLMQDHRLWSIRHKTVVPAVALGIFIVFMPFPGHPVWATLAALVDGDRNVHGNRVPDAWIASMALAHGGTVATRDTGFRRFAGLRSFDPVAPA